MHFFGEVKPQKDDAHCIETETLCRQSKAGRFVLKWPVLNEGCTNVTCNMTVVSTRDHTKMILEGGAGSWGNHFAPPDGYLMNIYGHR